METVGKIMVSMVFLYTGRPRVPIGVENYFSFTSHLASGANRKVDLLNLDEKADKNLRRSYQNRSWQSFGLKYRIGWLVIFIWSFVC